MDCTLGPSTDATLSCRVRPLHMACMSTGYLERGEAVASTFACIRWGTRPRCSTRLTGRRPARRSESCRQTPRRCHGRRSPEASPGWQRTRGDGCQQDPCSTRPCVCGRLGSPQRCLESHAEPERGACAKDGVDGRGTVFRMGAFHRDELEGLASVFGCRPFQLPRHAALPMLCAPPLHPHAHMHTASLSRPPHLQYLVVVPEQADGRAGVGV